MFRVLCLQGERIAHAVGCAFSVYAGKKKEKTDENQNSAQAPPVNPSTTAAGIAWEDMGGLVVTRLLLRKVWGSITRSPKHILRFNSRASTLAGKQCWLCAVRLQQTVIV